VQVRLLLGESLLAGGIYTDALEVFAAALPLAEPAQKAAVLIGQGRALLAAGRAEGAEETLGSALDFATSAEERAEILRWRSRAYLALADYERALADLVAAEELAPLPLYRYWKAEIYEVSGQTDRARDELAAFLREVDPEEVDPDIVAAAEEQLAALTETP
jgi:tetratricopeptide (TPR) repeat protein